MKYLSKLLILLLIPIIFSASVYAAPSELIAASASSTASPAKNNDYNVYAVITAQGNTALRSNSSSDSYIVASHPTGYALTVLGAEYGWVFVADDSNRRGYIKGTEIAFKNGTKPDNKAAVAKAQLKEKADSIAAFAKKYVGTPYVWGGTSLKTGVDCSGFVYCVYKSFGYTLNRSSAAMYTQGKSVNTGELMKGDLVFFGNSSVNHVGIYIGDNQYIHASTEGVGVIISQLGKSNGYQKYMGARRIIA